MIDHSKHRLLLIVEDDNDTRRALGRVFTSGGWQLCLATTVASALNLLNHGLEPDCLILDLGLPDGAGEAILKRIRDARLQTFVVVCTGIADPVRFGRIRELTPDLLLNKPVDSQVILNACEAMA